MLNYTQTKHTTTCHSNQAPTSQPKPSIGRLRRCRRRCGSEPLLSTTSRYSNSAPPSYQCHQGQLHRRPQWRRHSHRPSSSSSNSNSNNNNNSNNSNNSNNNSSSSSISSSSRPSSSTGSAVNLWRQHRRRRRRRHRLRCASSTRRRRTRR